MGSGSSEGSKFGSTSRFGSRVGSSGDAAVELRAVDTPPGVATVRDATFRPPMVTLTARAVEERSSGIVLFVVPLPIFTLDATAPARMLAVWAVVLWKVIVNEQRVAVQAAAAGIEAVG